jgi:hypothetical protein
MILAGAFGSAAVFFVLTDDYEKAFIVATAGAVCWFLNYRQKLRASLPSEDEESDDEETDEEVRS